MCIPQDPAATPSLLTAAAGDDGSSDVPVPRAGADLTARARLPRLSSWWLQRLLKCAKPSQTLLDHSPRGPHSVPLPKPALPRKAKGADGVTWPTPNPPRL